MKKMVRCEGIYVVLFITVINLLINIIFITDIYSKQNTDIQESRYQFEQVDEQYVIFDNCTGDYWISESISNNELNIGDTYTSLSCSIGRYSISFDNSNIVIMDTLNGKLHYTPIENSSEWIKINLNQK